MQTVAVMKCFCTGSVPSACSLVIPLHFNPIRLLFLIAWIYICLYFVQRVQFSPLVPKNRKSMANVFALFAGPILLLLLVIVDAVKKSSQGNMTVCGVIAENMRTVFASLRPGGFITRKDDSRIKLLDTSGRGIKEIFSHERTDQADRRVLDFTEQTILNALEDRASDILVDPKDNSTHTIRFRVDGVLKTVEQIDSNLGQAVINSIKAVSKMDISEKRRPQDGAFTAKTPETTASFRVASAGVLHGEKLSIRVLNQVAGTFTLTNVGLPQKQRAIVQEAIRKPAGMVLACGPTGSGKTTTLYAMLHEIDFFTRNVITVEDPIECVMPNVSQIEVNPKADITFAKSLRSILRQDPDVICVGEIRDEETAGIALRASQTGHLVLATIHSETNASALIRLLDLGVTPLLLSSGLSIMVAQRLLRRLCNHCKRPAELSQVQVHDFLKRGINYKCICEPVGCHYCDGTGYYARIGVFDILILDDKLKAGIANNKLPVDGLRKEGDKRGKSNIFKQGLKTVVSGITSLEELKRVIG